MRNNKIKSRQEKTAENLQRQINNRITNETILIICEGKKTEKNYFIALRDHYKIESIFIEIDPNSDPSPSSIVEYAKSKINDGYDKIYCVFDRDKHNDFNKAKNSINSNKKLQAIISNPCFEYWILLHFEKTTKCFGSGSKSPCDELVSKNLKKYIKDYSKGYNNFRQIIESKLKLAIQNAKEIHKTNPNDENIPFTDVWILVDKFEKIAKKSKIKR